MLPSPRLACAKCWDFLLSSPLHVTPIYCFRLGTWVAESQIYRFILFPPVMLDSIVRKSPSLVGIIGHGKSRILILRLGDPATVSDKLIRREAGLKGYFPGRRTRHRFVPPMFFTVPPIPALRIALTAPPMSFCGTWRTFCGARLFVRRWAAASNPADEPLRSTSVARPPPLVRASRRCLPRRETSVLPPEPAARFLARRCEGVSGIARNPFSILVRIPPIGDLIR